jgi:hypothetical protein
MIMAVASQDQAVVAAGVVSNLPGMKQKFNEKAHADVSMGFYIRNYRVIFQARC